MARMRPATGDEVLEYIIIIIIIFYYFLIGSGLGVEIRRG